MMRKLILVDGSDPISTERICRPFIAFIYIVNTKCGKYCRGPTVGLLLNYCNLFNLFYKLFNILILIRIILLLLLLLLLIIIIIIIIITMMIILLVCCCEQTLLRQALRPESCLHIVLGTLGWVGGGVGGGGSWPDRPAPYQTPGDALVL